MSVVDDPVASTLGALDAVTAVTVEDADFISVGISGTWVGTISFEATIDNTNWYTLTVHSSSATDKKAAVSSTTANGLFFHDLYAFKQIRARMSAYTSGTATVKFFTTRSGV